MSLLRTALLSTVLLAGIAPAQALDVHIDLYGGVFEGSEDTKPVDQRNEVGLMADLTLDMPFGFCANVLYNKDDVDNSNSGLTKVETTEIQLGLFKQFGVPVVHPFIGGGVAFLNSKLGSSGGNDDESVVGGWAYVGARMNFLLIDFGAVLGYTYAHTDVAGQDVDLGGFRGGIFLGVGF